MLPALSFALLLAAGEPAAPASPAAGGGDLAQSLEPDSVEVPPGPAADQALWRELRDGTAFATGSLARVAQVSFRMKYGRYFQELEARAKAPDGAEAQAALAQLRGAVERARERIPKQPGIYQCRHVLLDLEVRMKGLPDPKAEADLPEARLRARECTDKMKGVLAAVTESAEALIGAMARADAYLKRSAPAVGPGQKVPSAQETLDSLKSEER